MTGEFQSDFPSSREAALSRLDEFLSVAGAYASKRNHVVPGHPHVSRLSPATRTRLLLETEVCEELCKLLSKKMESKHLIKD